MFKKLFPNYIFLCVSLFTLSFLTACSQSSTDSKYIYGSAVKGVISAGIIRVYASKQDKHWIAESRTNQYGQFALELHTLDLPALYLSDTPLLLELSVDKNTRMRCDLTDGCIDHANGQLASFGDDIQLPNNFKLFGLAYSHNGNNLSYISPLSHLIVSTALKNNQELTIDSINIATKWVNNAFKLSTSPLETQPKDITQLAQQPIMTDEQLKQSILSAALYPETLSPAWPLGNESIDTVNLKGILSRASELAGDLSTLMANSNPNQASTLNRIQSDTETHLLTFDTPDISILSQPDSMAITEHEPFNLYVQANSDLDLSYQWYKNNEPIPGANSAIYSNTSGQVSDTGVYHILISNSATEKRSLSASINVSQTEASLQITQQPQSQSITEGDPISLSVTSLGEGTISYQWQRNGSLIPGATASTYTITNSQPQDAGTYRVVVSNEDKQLNSNFVNVWVKEVFHDITITQQPEAQVIQAGSTFTLSVNASSDATLSYQWYKNDLLILGANSTSYSSTSSQISDTGVYHVLINNSSTEQRSLSTPITVNQAEVPLQISQQPLGQSVIEGNPISLSVTTLGEGIIHYQWQKNGSLIPGATSSTYNIPNSQTQDAGVYRVIVSNKSNQLNSNFINVLVSKAVHNITISQQPQTKTIQTGSTITLSVSASSSAHLSFQWYKNNQLIPGANSPSYSKTSSQVSDTGLYHVLVSNSSTEQHSLSASLTVTPAEYNLQITQQPQGQSVTEGDLVSLSVISSGEGTIQYQWQKNGSLIPGATSSTYSIPNSKPQDAGAYRVVVSNESKQLNSNFVNVWVTEAILPVTIYQQPQTKVIPEGNSVEFNVSADGGGFVRYQWRKNGVEIDNAFNPTLTLTSVSQLDSAIYDVTVSNSQGSVVSAPANLSVITDAIPITITHQPESQTILPGTSVILSVSTSVEEAISYQWFLNGNPIDSANSAHYQIQSADIEDQGKYTALVSNASSSELSEAAQITLEQAKSNSIELTWDTPTEREDGSPLSFNEVQGYVIEYGNSSIDLQHSVKVDSLLPNTYIINDLPLGTLFLRIATIDSDNKQGAFSQVINITLH